MFYSNLTRARPERNENSRKGRRAKGETERSYIQETKKEHEGDITLITFPLLKVSKKNPVQTAQEIGEVLMNKHTCFESFNVVSGFLNLVLKPEVWINQLSYLNGLESIGISSESS